MALFLSGIFFLIFLSPVVYVSIIAYFFLVVIILVV